MNNLTPLQQPTQKFLVGRHKPARKKKEIAGTYHNLR